MAGLIPASFIDDLLARTDIVAVIERRVQLKKAGREWTACCPFHSEKTPSFTVSPQKQFYHCFGCGAHGSAITFLMEYEHLEFPDAVEELAHDLGLQVPREGGGPPPRSRQGLYTLLAEVQAHYREMLAGNAAALAYCERRGLGAGTRAAFGIGWAPGGDLVRRFGTTPERRAMLEEAGLLGRGERDVYERFRQRLMIPIRDRRGRVIAFGGRLLQGEGPKYLNSPETPLFHKGRELFGLWEVKQASTKLERIVVVEGYMDAIALHQAGLPLAVATLGTSTTPEHAERLFRSAPNLIFAFDGDRAGRAAAWRALEAILPRLEDGRDARFLFLPEGRDPDDVVRAEGREGFAARMDAATPLSEYFFAALAERCDLGSAEGRARLVSLARPLLERLPAGSFRALLQAELEQRVGVAVAVAAPPAPAPRRGRPVQRRRSLVRNLIALLLQAPALAREIEDPGMLAALDLRGIELFRELVEVARGREDMTVAMLMQHFETHAHAPALHQLLAAEQLVPEDAAVTEFRDGLRRLERQAVRQRVDALRAVERDGRLDAAAAAELLQLLQRKAALDTGTPWEPGQ